ncbi:Piso0_002299 [Millerozyma farinosa CBS 7064]|uniref:Piso0_002299 protein n=1 Tax=Pichia sorbitophila (strain ATCC MYA-4447 / BCRC 22081 / CBS 7064 / NBRC 10061 / NRRL Y-12695) TaxID=559304 RepID=G8YEN8_PICSO|nr:Piso0_002299 [Millerozyma farinosa CBS 7064]
MVYAIMVNPQRIIELQKTYQNSNKKLWLRGKHSKFLVFPFYALFTFSTTVPLFYAGRAILGIKDE